MNLIPSSPFLVVSLMGWGATMVPMLAEPVETAVVPTSKVALFDGKSLTGWTFVSEAKEPPAASIWSVKDGSIVCQGKPNGYARTLRKYRDYQLHLEWRFPSGPGNSGVFLHLGGEDKVWATCLEVQLLTGAAGEVRCNGGSRVQELTGGSNIAVPRRVSGSEKPLGEWNHCDIICRGETMTVTVNGVIQNQVTGASVGSGAIGLQAEGKPVEFREIVIEPLP
jgi:hypothetical protein